MNRLVVFVELLDYTLSLTIFAIIEIFKGLINNFIILMDIFINFYYFFLIFKEHKPLII